MELQAQECVVVPPEQRLSLLRQRDHVFIQSEDESYWVRPTRAEDSFLVDFLKDNYSGAPKRFWNVRTGTRIGFNSDGMFLHEDHHKRYWGLERAKASVSTLSRSMSLEDAVPMVNAKGERITRGTKTEQILSSMLAHLPTITDDMRYKVLHASFQRADRNGNGKLSRPELGIILRRVVYTLTSNDVERILREADQDHDGAVNYQEFVEWLRRSADPRFGNAFGNSLRNDADIVRATFRLWDKNGDGLVPCHFLNKALAKVHPDLTQLQVDALVKCMDCDHDGNVDYDEFVDFLFHRAERS